MSANAYVLKEIFEMLKAISIQQSELRFEIKKLQSSEIQPPKGNEGPSPWALKKKEAEDQLKERIVKQQIEVIQNEKPCNGKILGVSIEDFAKYLKEMKEEQAIEILDELFTRISKK